VVVEDVVSLWSPKSEKADLTSSISFVLRQADSSGREPQTF